jgi:hypothetical protein
LGKNSTEISGDNIKMMDVTFFTMPRHFIGNFKIIQYNAIRSWLAFNSTPEVILCGNDEGVAEAAADLGVVHIPDIELSKEGTPLISSVFSKAKAKAKNSVLVCSNADIILTSDFLETIDTVISSLPHRFMVVGQRWDLLVTEYIDFSTSWENDFCKEVRKSGTLHPICGIDYFVFEKENSIDMLPFPVGRTCWDNWYMSKALAIGFDVVDATEKIFAVHQNHRQFHMKEYMNNRTGEESKLCRKLAKGKIASISNANWTFSKGKLLKK